MGDGGYNLKQGRLKAEDALSAYKRPSLIIHGYCGYCKQTLKASTQGPLVSICNKRPIFPCASIKELPAMKCNLLEKKIVRSEIVLRKKKMFLPLENFVLVTLGVLLLYMQNKILRLLVILVSYHLRT